MPSPPKRPLIRDDGHIVCSSCSKSERTATYLPRNFFSPFDIAKAEEYDGHGRSPILMCKLCKMEKREKTEKSRKSSPWPELGGLADYLAFIFGPRSPYAKLSGGVLAVRLSAGLERNARKVT